MMVGLSGLWIPIVVSAVFVFIVSSIIHMGPFWHKTDFSTVPNEDALRKAVGPMNIPAGDYLVPRPASMDDMKTDAYKNKLKEGPILIMTVKQPGGMSMT